MHKPGFVEIIPLRQRGEQDSKPALEEAAESSAD